MKSYSIILYISIVLFVTSLILWYMSGENSETRRSSKKVYIGGFMFFSALLGGLLALILWAIGK